jgi:preprotein translocase subunit SecE
MSSITEATSNPLDRVLISVSLLVVGGAIAAFYLFPQFSALVRVGGLLAAVVVAVLIALQTEIGRGGARFMGDTRTEVRKVVWPTRAETVHTTLMVMVMVVLVAIFLWLLDMLLLWGVQNITGQGG